MKYKYTKLMTTPIIPYIASIKSVVFINGNNVSYIKLAHIINIPIIIVCIYFYL